MLTARMQDTLIAVAVTAVAVGVFVSVLAYWLAVAGKL